MKSLSMKATKENLVKNNSVNSLQQKENYGVSMLDNRTETAAQMKMAEIMQQADDPAQRELDEEELMQGKMAAQRELDEEELMGG